jgi:pimeloyl-ACP methyl ester carboxylesterase
LVALVAVTGLGVGATGITFPATPEKSKQSVAEVVLRDGLVLPPVGRFGRSPLHVDALEAEIVAGKWSAPKAGDAVPRPDGSTQKWEPAQAGKDGTLKHAALGGGYAYFAVPATEPKVMILEAAGHNLVYVNGEPRAGDTYQHGYVRLPVLLRQGNNDMLFHVGHGSLRAKLIPPKADLFFDLGDTTLPDLVTGQEIKHWAAVVVSNATTKEMDQLLVQSAFAGAASTVMKLPPLSPLSTRKTGFLLEGPAPKAAGNCAVEIKLLRKTGDQQQILDTAKINLRVCRPEQTHKRTFISTIDGSVQYYSLVPQARTAPDGLAIRPTPEGKPALVLTLHGAAVEATSQAACYAPKSWTHIVAPTNRRPYGFDWEDWGRLDALEVLELTSKQLDTDPRRTYLTGHSMGGHGTWHLGVTYPDRFAAIAPSAGWISMWSYAGALRAENPDALQEILMRAASPSDTLALARNYLQEGIYILHGDKDDKVLVAQARTMRQLLGGFHPDFAYHEEPGAGHWWGNACVDWPPLFEFLERRKLPSREQVRQVEFATASPGVSAWSHWAGIEAQTQALKVSSVQLRYNPDRRLFTGTTTNVARLAIDLGHVPPGKPVEVELDGQKLAAIAWPDTDKRIWLTRDIGRWSVSARPPPALKGPDRYGPFKEAFRNRVLFVYGTQGTPEENAWAFAKARLDAETFWYRGNASVDVVADMAFAAAADPERNIILYGNADTNAAWKTLLAESPVQVRRGQVRLGERAEAGNDLAVVFLRPRPGSARAAVGIVSGTGVVGMRLTDRLPYFLSGVGFPDCLVLGPETLARGVAGVRAAGFFGLDWSVSRGEIVWHK